MRENNWSEIFYPLYRSLALALLFLTTSCVRHPTETTHVVVAL